MSTESESMSFRFQTSTEVEASDVSAHLQGFGSYFKKMTYFSEKIQNSSKAKSQRLSLCCSELFYCQYSKVALVLLYAAQMQRGELSTILHAFQGLCAASEMCGCWLVFALR